MGLEEGIEADKNNTSVEKMKVYFMEHTRRGVSGKS